MLSEHKHRLAFVAALAFQTTSACDVETEPPSPEQEDTSATPSIPGLLPDVASVAGVTVLRGSATVDAFGAASYVLPLELPPGRAGMSPSLALTYSSNVGTGRVGVGWSLQGESAIVPCHRTIAIDNRTDGSDLDGFDALCLDGQRLIGPYGGPYRLERDDLTSVVATTRTGVPGSATWDAASFTVKHPDGRESIYSARYDAPSGRARAYYRTSTADTSGNTIRYVYESKRDVGRSHDLGVPTDRIRLASIDYTSNDGRAGGAVLPASRRVTFVYGGVLAATPTLGFADGAGVDLSEVVRSIEIEVNGALAYEYTLAYEASPATTRARLVSVNRCDAQNICGDPTRFEYSGTGLPTFDSAGSYIIDAARLTPPALGDLDGDGATDLAYLVRSGNQHRAVVHWGLKTNGAFAFGFSVEIPIDLGAAASGISVSDFDADGFGDLLITDDIGYALLHSGGAARSFSLQSLPWGSRGGVVWGDFNGDGRVDYAACTNGLWQFWANDPSIAVPAPVSLHLPCPNGGPPAIAVDVDGDGASELVAGLVRQGHPVEMGIGGLNYPLRWLPLPIVEPIEGYPWVPQGATFTEPRGTTTIHRSRVADFNADNLPDFLYPEQVTTEQVPVGASVFMWTGAGVLNLLPAFSITSTPPRAYDLADINADARTDHVFVWNDRLHVELTGNMESRQASAWKIGEVDVTLGNGLPDVSDVYSTDVNADGNVDFVITRAREVQVVLGSGARPDLLRRIYETRSTYAAASFDYATLGQASVYDSAGCASSYPIQCARPSSMVVVERLDVGASNQTGPRVRRYEYTRGRHDLSGRGFLGFEKVTATDPETNQTHEEDGGVPVPFGPTRYYVSGGASRRSTVRTPLPDGTAIIDESGEETEVAVVTSNAQTYYRVQGRRSWSREFVEGSTRPRAEQTTTVTARDSRGSPTAVRIEWLGGDYREVTSTYHHDAAAHVYGLPLTQTIVDHARVDGLWRVGVQSYEWRYDARGRLDHSSRRAANDPLRLTTRYRYDGYGNPENVRLISAHDGTRSSTASHLDPDRMYPTSVTNALGHTTTFEYHPVFGVVRRRIDPNGEISDFAYDSFGSLRAVAPPSSPLTTYDRQLAHGEDVHHRELTNAPGRPTMSLDIDHLGRTVGASSYGFDGREIISAVAYDSRGRVSRSSGWSYRRDLPRDFVSITYDALDRVSARERADGQRVDLRYESSGLPDGSGLAVVETDVLGNETRSVFDGRGRLVQLEDAKRGVLQHKYGAFGWPLETRDPTGAISTVDFDPYGLRLSIDDPSQGRLSTQYDAFGDAKSWIDGAGNAFSMTRDALGRPRVKSLVGSSQQDAWFYDEPLSDGCARSARVPGKNPHSIGRLTCAISADGHSSEHEYDAGGRPSRMQYRVGSRAMAYDYVYDAEGRIEQLLYPESIAQRRLAVRYRYQNGMISRAEIASTGHVLWQRERVEASGATLESSAGNGVRTIRSYRPMGAIATERHVGLSGQALFDFAYDYDRAGDLIAQRDLRQVMSERYGYDELHRLRRACIDNSIEPATDDEGLPEAPTWPLPDALNGHFQQAQTPANTALQLSAWRNLARSPQQGARAVAVTRALGVPVDSDGSSPGARGSQPACVDYDYDAIGNLRSSTDRGQLRYPAAKPSGLPMAHAPDRVTKPNGQVIALGYDEAGRLTSADAERFEWTASGKLRRVVGTPNLLSANETFYEYGPDGAVARRSRPFGSTVYAGGLYERTESQSFISARQTWSARGTHAKYMVQVEGRVIAEIIEHEVGYTAVRRGEGTGVWSDRGGPLSTSALDQAGLFVPGAWTIAYLHADRVGSTVLVTDDEGAVVDRRNYDAFGWARSPEWRVGNGGSTFGQQSVGYAEGVEDPGSGWVSMGARMYVPWLARFASPDPLISSPGTQARARYSYADNNPLRWRDTTGLDETSVDTITPTKTTFGEWEDEIIVGTPPQPQRPRPPPPPPPPAPPVADDAHDRALPYRAPGLSEVTRQAMARNRAAFNEEARAESERASWKDKVITAATVAGTAGAFIPVVGDALSLVSSVVVFAVEPTAENALGVVGDAAGLLIPGVPGLGSVKRAASMAAHASDANHIVGGVRDAEKMAEVVKDVERGEDLAKSAKGRASNQFKGPDPQAEGPHTRFRSDDKGVTTYETYDFPGPGLGKRVDAVGPPHGGVPTPHTVEVTRHTNPRDPTRSSYREGRPRPATPDEIPARRP